MSIARRFKRYAILDYSVSQDSVTGRRVTEWRYSGKQVRGAFYSGYDFPEDQQIFYRSKSAYLLTLGRPKLEQDKNRIDIDGRQFEVTDVQPSGGSRYWRINLKVVEERNR